jgi:hypothetical protein
MPDYTKLKGVTNIADSMISTQISDNIIEFFNWGLLEAGSYFNVNMPATGLYGGNKHELRLVDDPNYSAGQVWEGYRSNWVWETGVSPSTQPIQVSGIYIGGAFQPGTGVGTYAHYVDYPNGRIVFDSAISTTSTVSAEFSYKWVNVIKAEGIPWFRELQYNSQRVDSEHFAQTGSGDWSQLGQARVQMPALAVEVVPRRRFEPYELGSTRSAYTDVLIHVLAEEEYVAAQLVDVVSLQEEKTLWMFDTNLLATQNKYPLNYRGELTTDALTSGRYPDLVSDTSEGGLRWKKMFIPNCVSQGLSTLNPSLYIGTVRMTTEVTGI